MKFFILSLLSLNSFSPVSSFFLRIVFENSSSVFTRQLVIQSSWKSYAFVRVQFRWTHCDHLRRPLARYVDSLPLYSSTSASFWHVDNAYHISLHEVHFITVITCTPNTRPDNRRDLEHNTRNSFSNSFPILINTPTGKDALTSPVEPTSMPLDLRLLTYYFHRICIPWSNFSSFMIV